MPCSELPDDLKTLWKETGMDQPMSSTAQLQEEAEKLQARRRKGFLLLSAVFFSAVVSYAFFVFYFQNILTRLGSSLALVVFGYLVIDTLVRRARVLPDLGAIDGLRFYRAELKRKRDWHRGVPLRFLLILVPLILVSLGLAQIFAKVSPFIPPVILSWTVALLVVLGIWAPAKHRRLARKYQDQIDALDSSVKSAGPANPKN
jgi:hypothetical protein